MSVSVEVQTRLARGNAVLVAIRTARSDEGAAGLLTAGQLRQLRDERLYALLGATSLQNLIAQEVPALNRLSLRRLLSIADAYANGDLLALTNFGLARLSLLAGAPRQVQEELLSGPVLPLWEMRRALRQEQGDREAGRLRGQEVNGNTPDPFLPVGEPAPDNESNRARARSLLGQVARTWREVGSAAWEQARLLTTFRDEHLCEAFGASLEEVLSEQVGVDGDELAREVALLEHLALVPVEHRLAAGISALRVVVAMGEETQRGELIARLEREPLAGDALISLARTKPQRLAPLPPAAPLGGALIDDPERLAPFSLLYLSDQDELPPFAEATPPELAEQIIRRLSVPGGRICDLTAGRGTFAAVAAPLSRTVTSIDRLDPPLSPGILVGDARTVQPEGAPFDLVVLHPPLPGETVYSERYTGRMLPGDMSLLKPETFFRAMREVLDNAFTLTRPGGALALICRESRADARLWDWPGRLGIAAEQAGFLLVDRLYAPLGPQARTALGRRLGFVARREGRTLPVVLSALLLRRPEKERGA